MHETTIASSILNVVLDSAARYSELGAPLHVTEIALQVGLLSCLEPKTLEGCFEIMAEGTPAEGAALNIAIKPLVGRCPDCGTVKTARRSFDCPLCGKNAVEWQGGHEMQVSSIKVEQVREKHGELSA